MTIDSDVVIIALFVFFKLQREKEIDELWIEFGVGKFKRWIPIHRYAEALRENVCIALPFFNAFTGSDTTSQFAGRGEKTAWRTWQALPDATSTFIRLSSLIDMSETYKFVLERFVCVMYDRGSTFTNVIDCRRYLFTKMSRSIENCPPTSNVLENHVKRAQLQSSIRTSALISDSESIDPLKWGWQKKRDGYFEPVWSTLPKVADVCMELKRW